MDRENKNKGLHLNEEEKNIKNAVLDKETQ